MITINRILCPIDFDGFSERALRFAVQMAHWYGASLHVLHVRPPQTASVEAERVRDAEIKQLQTLIDRYEVPRVQITTELMELAEPADAILKCADARDVDLIVTGSHGRSGLQRVLAGSVVEGLLHRSGRPVLTIPSHLDPVLAGHVINFSHILCAVDFSGASIDALAYALSIAEESEAQLSILHVIEKPPELAEPSLAMTVEVQQIRAAAEAQKLAQLRALVPADAQDFCTIDTSVVEGGAARQILRRAADSNVDLIVLGVHGRSAFDLAFFGSNSKDVTRHAHCPVLIVPARRQPAAQ